MMPEARTFAEAWRRWAVPGEIIQIRAEDVLFRPRASTRPFWLTLGAGGSRPEGIGPCELIVHPAVFNCKRLVPKRGESLRAPRLHYRGDEIERVRGTLLQCGEGEEPFVVDLGFPVVVDQLERCESLSRAQVGDILELEFVPPTSAHLL